MGKYYLVVALDFVAVANLKYPNNETVEAAIWCAFPPHSTFWFANRQICDVIGLVLEPTRPRSSVGGAMNWQIKGRRFYSYCGQAIF